MIDVSFYVCYSKRANGRTEVFFLCSNLSFGGKRIDHMEEDPTTTKLISGGGSRAHKNYTGMYGMQTT